MGSKSKRYGKLLYGSECVLFSRALLLAGFLLASPLFSKAQLSGGIIARSQCVISGNAPNAFTSARDASTGTGIAISWENSTDNFATSSTIIGATSQTYAPGNLSGPGTKVYYRRKVTNTTSGQVAYSNVITVSIYGAKTDPTFTPVGSALPKICQQTTSFSVQYNTTGSPDKYSIFWDSTANAQGFTDVTDAALAVSGNLSVTASATAAVNTYTGTLVAIISSTGCSVSNASAVIVNQLPTITITSPAAVCTPAAINLTSAAITAQSTPTGMAFTQWNDAAATSSLSNASAVTQTGTYYIKGTISATGCAVTKPVTATINPLPTVVVTLPTICGSLDLTAPSITSSGSTANLSYTQWANAAATASLNNATAITATGTYYIKGTIAATGCAIVKPATVTTVNPLPTVVVTLPTICGTVDLTSPSVTSSGSTANLSYTQWANAAATSSLNNAAAITVTGTYYIKGTIAATGCAVTKAVTATVNPYPTLTINTPTAACAPGTADITAASVTNGSTAGLNYSYWSDAAASTALNNANRVAASGLYYIKGTIPLTGCAVVQPVTVTVNPSPTVFITNPAAVCTPGTVDITLPAVIAGSTAGLTYSYWSNAAASSLLSNANSIPASGIYYIKGTVPATNCFVVQPVSVTINPYPAGVLANPAGLFICGDSASVLSASNAASYQWYYNQSPVSGAISATFTARLPGTYTVRFTSAAGCVKDADNSIVLQQLFKPSLSFGVDITCAGSPVNFTNYSAYATSGQINWLWDFGDGNFSTQFSPANTFIVYGNYPVKLTAINQACPNLTDSVINTYTMALPPLPFRYNTIDVPGGKPTTIAARPTGISYLWQPATGLNSPYVRTPVVTLSQKQVYTISITNAAGCVTVDTVLVNVLNSGDIYVGKGFTPNNDGNNDRCFPILVGIRSLTYFKIFNRWGNLVFQTNSESPLDGWDGKYNGKMQPSGTYQWVAEAIDGGGNIVKRNGAVLLIN